MKVAAYDNNPFIKKMSNTHIPNPNCSDVISINFKSFYNVQAISINTHFAILHIQETNTNFKSFYNVQAISINTHFAILHIQETNKNKQTTNKQTE